MSKRIKKTSMQDIADYLNISKNSVALALNNKKGVSEELKAKIIQAAVQLNYGGLEQDLTKEKNLLLIIPEYLETAFNFYYEIILGLEKSAQKKEMRVIMTSLDRDREQTLSLPAMYYGMSFSGIILLGIFSEAYVEMVAGLRVPFLAVDHAYARIKHKSVMTANMEGSREVVSYLIGKGHKNIGFIGPVRRTASNFERWLGYCAAMEDAGLTVDSAFCFRHSEENISFSLEEIKQYLAGLTRLPTAWFCANDYMAMYLMEALQLRGLAVPGDISVAGFDDISSSQFTNPKLTTLHVRRDRMSEAAIDMMATSLESDEYPYHVRIYGDLVERDSVKAL